MGTDDAAAIERSSCATAADDAECNCAFVADDPFGGCWPCIHDSEADADAAEVDKVDNDTMPGRDASVKQRGWDTALPSSSALPVRNTGMRRIAGAIKRSRSSERFSLYLASSALISSATLSSEEASHARAINAAL